MLSLTGSPFEDSSFDAAVVAQVLCSVPDQAVALAELRRVMEPGGELRFYEHVLAREARHTGRAIEEAGFTIGRCRRFDFRLSFLDYPVAPRILRAARR